MSYLSFLCVYVVVFVHVLTLSSIYVDEVMQFRSLFWMTSVLELPIIRVKKIMIINNTHFIIKNLK